MEMISFCKIFLLYDGNVLSIHKKLSQLATAQTVDKVPVFAGTFTMSTVFLV